MNLPRIENKNLQNEIHIWAVDLDQWNLSCLEAVQALPETEKKKAERFRFEIHGSRYIKGRFMLRSLLGKYLDMGFYDQEFHTNRHGKPAVHKFHDDNSIHFNMSNSENTCICALSRHGDVGIDIEKINNLNEIDSIANSFYTPAEKNQLRSLSEPDKIKTFFRFWTRKEALLKASGVGLNYPFDKVDVSNERKDTSQVFIYTNDLHPEIRWKLMDIDIFEGFASALAINAYDSCSVPTIKSFHFPLDHMN